MVRRRHIRHIKHPINKNPINKNPINKNPLPAFILLDRFSVEDIHKWAAFKDGFLKYYWDYYKDLAYQRSKIADKIRKSILGAAEKDFKFERWQRTVRYKYTLKPFSVIGSLTDPGGRFNIGDINPSQFPPFPSLYLASDKKTSLQELLCQKNERTDQVT